MSRTETPIRKAARMPIEGVEGAFLRVDRGGALYISDALKRGASLSVLQLAYDEAGFDAREEQGLIRIVPGRAWIHKLTEAVYRADYEDEQSRLLARFIPGDISDEEHIIWINAVKCLEGSLAAPPVERKIREAAARCLRQGSGGGALFHAYMLVKVTIS